MTNELAYKVAQLLKCKIKEPTYDLILAVENHVRVKLSIQNRSFEQLDSDYLAELIAESTLQLVVSYESASLLEPLSIVSRLIIT